MFIRYNETIRFYEYDTSPGQTGAGPWLLLPLDASKLIGSLPDRPFGEWQDVPFNAGGFAGIAPLVWTVASGNIVNNSYVRFGKTVIWTIAIDSSQLTGAPSNGIYVNLPPGMTTVRHTQINAHMHFGGTATWKQGIVVSPAGIGYLNVYVSDFSNFVLGAYYLYFQMSFQIA